MIMVLGGGARWWFLILVLCFAVKSTVESTVHGAVRFDSTDGVMHPTTHWHEQESLEVGVMLYVVLQQL
jgi:hypothetical protein